VFWVIAGAAFGAVTGILARRFDYWSFTGGLLGGMLAAPGMLVMFLLIRYWEKLLVWAAAGALIGVLGVTLFTSLAGQILPVGGADVLPRPSAGAVMDRALIGALITVWLASGGVVFGNGTSGVIGLLGSGILGAPLGALVRVVGPAVSNQPFTVQILGQQSTWLLGEVLVGIPIGLVAGILITQYFFPVESQADSSRHSV